MYKKTITYTDFDGLERTEDFYFNLTKAEVVKLEYSIDGGLRQRYERIAAAKDARQIMIEFDKLIRLSYGEKSADGRHFVKSEAISDAFASTPAYDSLFMELVTDATKAADFVNQIIPEEAREAEGR